MRPRERDPAARGERVLDAELRLADALGLALLLLALLVALLAAEDLERAEVDRALLAPELRELLLRAPLLLDFAELPLLDFVEPRLLLAEAPPSIDHLPLITRLAASVTASAINEPNFVALESTDFAALSAVSAASIPASRMAFRAFGLALIAAAAAARPAASISLLIAALASFSVVVLEDADEREPAPDAFEPVLAVLEREPGDLAPVLLLDLAIANLPLVGRLDT